MPDTKRASRFPDIALLAAAIGAIVFVLLGVCGFPIIGHDSYVQVSWLTQFVSLREQGVAYPRWLMDAFGGLGAPTFYYYPPFPYFLASVLYSLRIATSVDALYHVLQLSACVLSGLTVYPLVRRVGGDRRLQLSAVLLYACGPYRFVDVYIRNALGEHWAFVWMPLVFLSVLLLEEKKRWLGIACASVGWLFLLITHMPTAMICGIGVCVFLIARKDALIVWLSTGAALMLGCMMAGYYLIPALGMRDLIHASHYVDIDFKVGRWGYTLADLAHGRFVTFVVIDAIVLLSACAVLVMQRARRDAMWWVLLAACFMQLPFVSQPLYDHVPPIQMLQLSFRWNALLTMAFSLYLVRNRSVTQCFFVVLSVTVICIGLFEFKHLSDSTSTANLQKTDAPEYTPRWANDQPVVVEALAARTFGKPLFDSCVRAQKVHGEEIEAEIVVNSNTTLTANTFYWPYRSVTIDGKTVEVRRDKTGRIQLDVESGRHAVRIVRNASPLERAGLILSSFAVGLFAILAIIGFITQRRKLNAVT